MKIVDNEMMTKLRYELMNQLIDYNRLYTKEESDSINESIEILLNAKRLNYCNELKQEYERVKKYLLDYEINFKELKKEFPNIVIPHIPIKKNEHLIFTDGYLFVAVKFDDKNNCWEYDSDRFYEYYETCDDEVLINTYRDKMFIKVVDIGLAINFIEERAFEN